MKILITGGCGFIGSNFIRLSKHKVTNLDCLTYAANKRIPHVKGTVCDYKTVEKYVKKTDYIIHFAAETHVDNSIQDAFPFVKTNIEGTYNICEAVKRHPVKKMIYVSTDEVYGPIAIKENNEHAPFNPTSPYAASKASADLIVQSYVKTHGIPAIIVRPSNNYGPGQHFEKMIPKCILNASQDISIPVYGIGVYYREWIYVEDTCRAIDLILRKGKVGDTYNIGSEEEMKNIDLVRLILLKMKKSESLITFVNDRLAHDYRYAVDSFKLKNELGWFPKVKLKDGLDTTIDWYLKS